jgi:hypothetical protein
MALWVLVYLSNNEREKLLQGCKDRFLDINNV